MSNLDHMASGRLGESCGHRASGGEDEAARKRSRHNEHCKASRKRVKAHKESLQNDVNAVNDEIAKLEKENTDNDQVGNKLQEDLEIKELQITELEGQIGEMEKEVADLNEKLKEFSTSLQMQLQPVISIFDLEGQSKEFEALIHMTTSTWDDLEKSKLMEEILKMEYDNSMLETELDALVEMIVQDSVEAEGNPAAY